jgi:hypothetical protein
MPDLTDSNSTLLGYALSTSPHPLQVSKTGAISIVASNPGGYSDKPEQDYVAVVNIVFDFGLKGTGGSELTATDGSAWHVTSPVGWAPPTIAGLKFTFTPPSGHDKIFLNDGLQFLFSQIPVNATVGTVTLTTSETASSPGNPAEPEFYPPHPRAVRTWLKPIGKFPADFTVGDLVAQPPNVSVGGNTTLSWSGTAGAAYEIGYNAVRITQHANGTLLQPEDTFPNAAAGDPLLVVRNRTVYTLTVTYTPPGGGTPAIYQRQATVSVYHPEPVIESFTATPDFIQVQAGSPAIVTLSWKVRNGRKPDCVAFTVTPPLPTYPAEGKGLQHAIKYSQPITMTAYGDEGTTPVSQERFILIGRTVNIGSGFDSNPQFVAVSPDNAYAFVTNQFPPSLSVVETPGTDITKWKAVAKLGGLLPNPSGVAVCQSSFGNFALVTTRAEGGGVVTVYKMSGNVPGQWPRTNLSAGLAVNADEVTVSADNRYIFVACTGAMNFPGPKSAVSILTVNGADPAKWPVFNLFSSDQQLLILHVSVSPKSDYAIITVKSNMGGPEQLWVLALQGSDPSKWPIVARLTPGLNRGSPRIAITPDRKLGLVPNFNGNALQVMDLSSSDPNQWRVTGSISMPLPVFAALSSDGRYAFVTNSFNNFVTVLGVSSDPPVTWPRYQLTQGIVTRPYGIATATKGAVAFIANDSFEPGSLTVVSLEPSIDPAAAKVAHPAKFKCRIPARDG